MASKDTLLLTCTSCENTVPFSLFDLKNSDYRIPCPSCGKVYVFSDLQLQSQIDKFERLCKQLVESEEILAQTAVGIDVGDQHVEIPYRLLLTRLNSTLSLQVDGETIRIAFRMEPAHDLCQIGT